MAADSSTDDGGLFSSRHLQLTLLRRMRLPSGKAYGRRVGNVSMKNVLKAIDDRIGSKPSWVIPIEELVESTGSSRSTVSGAISVLQSLSVLEVTERFEEHDGKKVQLPSRYQIIWSNLLDYEPQPKPVSETPKRIVEVARSGGTPSPGGQLTSGGGSTHCELGVDSVADGGQLTSGGGSARSELRPSPEPAPDVPNPSPFCPPDGEGKDLFWREAVKEPQLLRKAVKSRDVIWLQTAWAEAIAAGWQSDDRETFVRFLTAAFYVVNPPEDFTIENCARVLRQKLIDNDWKTGCMQGDDDDWARETLRRIEHPVPVARGSDLTRSAATAGVPSRGDQITALRKLGQQTNPIASAIE